MTAGQKPICPFWAHPPRKSKKNWFWIQIFKVPMILLKITTLPHAKFSDFWNWTHKNIPDGQHSARFRKSRKSSILLHLGEEGGGGCPALEPGQPQRRCCHRQLEASGQHSHQNGVNQPLPEDKLLHLTEKKLEDESNMWVIKKEIKGKFRQN